MRRPVALLVSATLVVVASACGGSETVTTDETPRTLEGVGQLPEPLTVDPSGDEVERTTIATTTSTIPRSTVQREAGLGEVGERVEGNRLIVIGDSITASIARRYGGEMCFALLPFGWAVEVNAEVARFVDFGTRVLDRRLRPDSGVDWDAAVVFLGSNYGGDQERYRAELFDILDRLAPRPTVLVTVTEFRTNRAEVNEVVRSMVDYYPQVQVLDWAVITAEDRSLLSGDGLHLSADGRARLAIELAAMLGQAPSTNGDVPAGECLSSSFTDDSAGRRPGAVVPPTLTGTGGSGGGSGGGSAGSSGGGSGSTAAPTTASPPPVGSGTTAPPPSPTAATTEPVVETTSPPTTMAPTTVATTVAPPTAPPIPPPSTAAPAPTASPTTPPGDGGGDGGGDSGGGGGEVGGSGEAPTTDDL